MTINARLTRDRAVLAPPHDLLQPATLVIGSVAARTGSAIHPTPSTPPTSAESPRRVVNPVMFVISVRACSRAQDKQADLGKPATATGDRPGACAFPASTAPNADIDACADEYVATNVAAPAPPSTCGMSIATTTDEPAGTTPPSPYPRSPTTVPPE